VALFAVVSNVILRPLPIPDADQILLMGNEYPKTSSGTGATSSVPDYFDRLKETDVFAEQAMYARSFQAVDQNGSATRVAMMFVTPSFFKVLRVAPAAGRTFTDEEGELGNTRKVVLSHRLVTVNPASRRAAHDEL
jgi:hypothetical protein